MCHDVEVHGAAALDATSDAELVAGSVEVFDMFLIDVDLQGVLSHVEGDWGKRAGKGVMLASRRCLTGRIWPRLREAASLYVRSSLSKSFFALTFSSESICGVV